MGKGFCEVKQLSISGVCHWENDADFEKIQKVTVTPRRKTYNKSIVLKAEIHDSEGNLNWFRPEIDNGCTITCIHPRIVRKYGLKTKPLPFSIPVVNADGSDNKQGKSSLVAMVHMVVDRHVETIEALVLDIGSNEMLLGLDWLAVHNPQIDWSKGIVRFTRCPEECQHTHAFGHISHIR